MDNLPDLRLQNGWTPQSFAGTIRRLWYTMTLGPVIIMGVTVAAVSELPTWLVWMIMLACVPVVSALTIAAGVRVRRGAGLDVPTSRTGLRPLKKALWSHVFVGVLLAVAIVCIGVLAVLIMPLLILLGRRDRFRVTGARAVTPSSFTPEVQQMLNTWPGNRQYVYPDSARPVAAGSDAQSLYVSESLMSGPPQVLAAAVAYEVARRHMNLRHLRWLTLVDAALWSLVGWACGATIGGTPAPWLLLSADHPSYTRMISAVVFGLLLGQVLVSPIFAANVRRLVRRIDALALRMLGTGRGLVEYLRPYAEAVGETVPPPRLYYLLRYSHPSYSERMQTAWTYSQAAPQLPPPTAPVRTPRKAGPRGPSMGPAIVSLLSVALVTVGGVAIYARVGVSQDPGFNPSAVVSSALQRAEASAPFKLREPGALPPGYGLVGMSDTQSGQRETVKTSFARDLQRHGLVTVTEGTRLRPADTAMAGKVHVHGLTWLVNGVDWYHVYPDGVYVQLAGTPQNVRLIARDVPQG